MIFDAKMIIAILIRCFKGGASGMPNIKSAKKRCLVISTKTLQNKMIKSELKSSIKKFEAAVEAGDKDTAKAAYLVAVKKIEKAEKSNVIHKNNSNRKKSALTLKLNKLA